MRVSGAADKAERAAEMDRLTQGGMTGDQVAARFGITRQRVHQILGQFGYPTRRPPAPPRANLCPVCGGSYLRGKYAAHLAAVGHKYSARREDLERNLAIVKEYLLSDKTTVEIAAQHGVHATVIYRLLKRYGLSPDRGGGTYARDEDFRARRRAARYPQTHGPDATRSDHAAGSR